MATSAAGAVTVSDASWLLPMIFSFRASSSALVTTSRTAIISSMVATCAPASAGREGTKSRAHGPTGQLHRGLAALDGAEGRRVALPHLVGGERQDGGHDPHEHLQDVHEHGLHGPRRGEAGASAYRRSLVTSMYTAEMSFT